MSIHDEHEVIIIGAGGHGKSDSNWAEVWNNSKECKDVQTELDRIHNEKKAESVTVHNADGEFAMPLTSQIYYVTVRVFQQYWRTPNYIIGKFSLCIMSALFIGFSFYRENSSSTGLQNTLFGVFLLTTIFSTLVQQVRNCSLYDPSPVLESY